MESNICGTLHGEALGRRSDAPIVFLPPNPMDGMSWLFQTSHFSTWYRTIAVDLPGYGRSPSALPGLTLEEMADACWTVVEQLSSSPAVLVGCSVGATVAQHMYHQRPTQVDAVILTGAGYNPTKAFAPKRIREYEESGLANRRQHVLDAFSPEFRKSLLASWFADVFEERNSTTDLGSIIAIFQALSSPDPAWLQSKLSCPVLVVSGSNDSAHPRAQALAERFPQAEFVTIDGAGHACYMEEPWLFNRIVLDFLRRLGRSAGPPNPPLT